MSISKRSLAVYAATWVALIAFALALAPRSPEPVRGPTPRSGGVLRLALLPMATLSPVDFSSSQEACLINQMYEGLVEFDVSLNVMPGLAQRWEIDENFRHFVFHLRDNLTFHTGRPISSADVVASITKLARRNALEPVIGHATLQSLSGLDEYLAGRSARIGGLRARTPRTVEIIFDRPAPDLLAIMATEPWKITGPAGEGAGPFRLAGRSRERIVLTRFEDYYGSPAFLDSIDIRIVPVYEAETELELFEAGEIDLVEMPTWHWDRYVEREDVRIHRRQGMTLEFLAFNLDHPDVADSNLRRRLAAAIDWENYIAADDPLFRRATALIPPGMAGYIDRPDLFRPVEAEAGSGAGGFSSPRAPLPYYVVGTPDVVYEEDLKIREAWARIGIETDYRPRDWSEFDARIEAGTAPLFTMAWAADLPSASHFLYDLFHSEGWGNYFAYRNEEVNRLLEEALVTVDGDERLELVNRAEEIILADVPIIPLDFTASVHVTREGLEGVALSPLGTGNMQCERFWWRR